MINVLQNENDKNIVFKIVYDWKHALKSKTIALKRHGFLFRFRRRWQMDSYVRRGVTWKFASNSPRDQMRRFIRFIIKRVYDRTTYIKQCNDNGR